MHAADQLTQAWVPLQRSQTVQDHERNPVGAPLQGKLQVAERHIELAQSRPSFRDARIYPVFGVSSNRLLGRMRYEGAATSLIR